MSETMKKIAAFCERHPMVYKTVLMVEHALKRPTLNCQDCGQCVASYNALTCVMRCPKQLRNGPCGGTRENGHCEVYPERDCIWFLVNERSKKLGRQAKLMKFHKPVDRRFQGQSAWINLWAGRIEGMSWSKDLEEKDRQPNAGRKDGTGG